MSLAVIQTELISLICGSQLMVLWFVLSSCLSCGFLIIHRLKNHYELLISCSPGRQINWGTAQMGIFLGFIWNLGPVGKGDRQRITQRNFPGCR